MRSDSSTTVIHSDPDLGNRRRPVFGSWRLSDLFHPHLPLYFSFPGNRPTVLDTHFCFTFFCSANPLSLSALTIACIELPIRNSLKVRNTKSASRGLISNLWHSGLGMPFLSGDCFAKRKRLLSQHYFASCESSSFLTDQVAQCINLRILKLQFIEYATNLNPKRRFVIIAVERIND